MAPVDLGTFFVDSLIVHEVPERRVRGESPGPVMSERLRPLDDEIKQFFPERIIRSLSGTQSFEVTVDDDAASPVPALVRSLLSDPSSDLVAASRRHGRTPLSLHRLASIPVDC